MGQARGVYIKRTKKYCYQNNIKTTRGSTGSSILCRVGRGWFGLRVRDGDGRGRVRGSNPPEKS